MKWAHLPVDGGIYAQDPEFLDYVEAIFVAKSAHEEREAKKREAEMGRKKSGGPRMRRRR